MFATLRGLVERRQTRRAVARAVKAQHEVSIGVLMHCLPRYSVAQLDAALLSLGWARSTKQFQPRYVWVKQ